MIRPHNRFDVQCGCEKCLQAGQTAVLSEWFQRINDEIGLLLIPHFQNTLRDLAEGKPLLIHIADSQGLV